MFENFSTAVIQAIGFFTIFGLFVYQLLSDGKKNEYVSKKFGNKVKEQISSKSSNKNSWFSRKPKTEKVEEPKVKNRWFR